MNFLHKFLRKKSYQYLNKGAFVYKRNELRHITVMYYKNAHLSFIKSNK